MAPVTATVKTKNPGETAGASTENAETTATPAPNRMEAAVEEKRSKVSPRTEPTVAYVNR